MSQYHSFSQNTQNLVKSMMKSAKLTYSQQQILDNILNEGDAFPPTNYFKEISRRRIVLPSNKPSGSYVYKYSKPKIRTREMILRRDPMAYQREKFISHPVEKNHEKEKLRLQIYMATDGITSNPDQYLKSLNDKKKRDKMENDVILKKEKTEEDIEFEEIDMLINEIKERKEFLDEMVKLGQGKKYKNKIEFEINERTSKLLKLREDKERENKKRRNRNTKDKKFNDINLEMQKLKI